MRIYFLCFVLTLPWANGQCVDRVETPEFPLALTPGIKAKVLTDGHGRIQTENFPGNVPQRRICLWEIEIPQGHQLECWFEGESLTLVNFIVFFIEKRLFFQHSTWEMMNPSQPS